METDISYACRHTCICVCIFILVHRHALAYIVCMYVHKYTYFTNTYVCLHICTCVYMLYECINLGMYTQEDMHESVCVCIYYYMNFGIGVCM